MGDSSVFSPMHIVFYIYNAVLVLLGLACLGVGLYLNADRDVWANLFIYKSNPSDDLLVAAAISLIIVGILVCIFAAMSIFGAFCKMRLLLFIPIFGLFIVFVWEATVGWMLVEYRVRLPKDVYDGMVDTITYSYRHDNKVGKAWNRVQVREKCCGAATDFSDYINSDWWRESNPGIIDVNDPKAVNVPTSCCKLIADQDHDPQRVDPQNPQVKDYARCNQYAAGKNRYTDFVNQFSCYGKLYTKNFNNMNACMGLSLTVAFYSLIGVFFGIAFFRSVSASKKL